MTACEHACGSTTKCARGGSLWNRAFLKGAFSRPSAVQHLLRGGYKRGLYAFKAAKDIRDALVHIRKITGRGGATAGEPALATSL